MPTVTPKPVECMRIVVWSLEDDDGKVGDVVKRGQQIGTMGNNRGMYAAHLHFEIRHNIKIGY